MLTPQNRKWFDLVLVGSLGALTGGGLCMAPGMGTVQVLGGFLLGAGFVGLVLLLWGSPPGG